MGLMLSRSQPLVGIDIGSHSIKIAMVEQRHRTRTLTRLGFAELLPESIVDGEVMDREAVVQTLRDLAEQTGVSRYGVVSGISGRGVIVKRIAMDKMKPEELHEAMKWEAEQHIPFDVDDVSRDTQILKKDNGRGQMEVLLVAAKRETVLTRAELLREAGLVPAVIDLDTFAVQNAYETVCTPGEGTTALVNIGAYVTSINIIQLGVPIFTRDLSIAGNSFCETLQRQAGLTAEEATVYLSGEEKPEEPSIVEEMKSTVETIGEELSLEIDRSISFTKTSGDAEDIDRIVLSGGGALMPGLLTFLMERHGVPTEIADPTEGLNCDPELFQEEPAETLCPRLMVALGLALRRLH